MNQPPLHPEEAAQEALETWSAEATRERLEARWSPALLARFAEVVRRSIQHAPEAAKRNALVRTARQILRGEERTRIALTLDPALGRWTSAMERALTQGDSVDALMALIPRFALGHAIYQHESIETRVIVGSGGRARIPVDGRVLQGPPSRPLRVRVEKGELTNHTRAARKAGPFEIIDGDAEAGALPSVQPISGGNLIEIVQPIKAGVKTLEASAPELMAEIHALSPTLVAVGGAKDVSHSASLSEARGCIWLTPVSRPLVIAETLVHEASHLKFFLAEDVSPFVEQPDPPRFEVPWRKDRRPLRAVLMGLHAWVRILTWLDSIEAGVHRQAADERSVILSSATLAAADIVEGAEGLNAAGKALVDMLCKETRER